MRDAVAAIFADRANLAATLVDARGVVRSLRSLLGGVVHAACCFLYLAIWDVSLFFVVLSCFLFEARSGACFFFFSFSSFGAKKKKNENLKKKNEARSCSAAWGVP